MSKLKSKFGKGIGKRVMALILSGAMVMSNMTVTAAELTSETAVEASAEETATEEITAETEESAVSESTTDKESSESEEAVEKKTEKESDEEKATEESDDSKSKKDTSESEKEEGKDEVAVNDAEIKTHTFTASSLSVPAASISDGTELDADGYFTVAGTGVQSKANSGGTAITSINLPKDNKVKIKVDGTATVEITLMSTGKSDTSSYELTDANGQQVADSNGKLSGSFTGGTPGTTVTYNNLTEGYYYIAPTSDTPKSLRIIKIVSTDTVDGGEKAPRAEWSGVASPSNVQTTLSTDGKSIEVSFDMVIGYDGADKVTVVMTKEGDEEGTSETKEVSTQGGTAKFTPKSSGKYNFALTASRVENSETKTKEAVTASYEFKLPLAAPSVKEPTKSGKNVSVSWNPVDEATGYKVTFYKGTKKPSEFPEEKTTEKGIISVNGNEQTSAELGALQELEDYTIEVIALRDEEESDPSKVTYFVLPENSNYTYYSLDLLQDEFVEGTTTYKGLQKDTEYGDASLVKFKPLANMKKLDDVKVVNGVSYDCIQSNVDTDKNVTVQTAANATLEITPVVSGKVSFTVANSNKTYHFVNKTTGSEIKTATLADAGTLSFDVEAGTVYQFYFTGSKSMFCKITYEVGTKPRKNWASVDDPAIVQDEIETAEDGTITVPFTMVIGNNGADSVAVTMSDESGAVIDTQTTEAAGEEGSVMFTPVASGKYKFDITAKRTDCDDKTGTPVEYEFSLPLTAPVLNENSLTYNDDGVAELSWSSVKEATGYEVTYYKGTVNPGNITEATEATADSGFIKIETIDGSVATKTALSSIEADVEYTFEVVAVRSKQAGETTKVDKSTEGKLTITPTGPRIVKRKGTVNITKGLKQGQIYGDDSVVKITVLEDMAAHMGSDDSDDSATIEGTYYKGFIQGTSNASPKNGSVATSGAVFVFEAVIDCNVSFVLNADKNNGKVYHFVNVTDNKDMTTGSDKVETGTKTFALEAGKTYQYYLDGSKACVYALKYSYPGVENYRTTNLVDLTGGLKAGETYGSEEVAIFSVLEDMNYKNGSSDGATLENTYYPGYVQGTNNANSGKEASGSTPENPKYTSAAGEAATAGAALVIDAKATGTVSIITNAAKNSGKTYYFIDVTDTENVEIIGTGTQVTTGTMTFDIESGHKYQFYLNGSKPCIYALWAEAGQKYRKEWNEVASPEFNGAIGTGITDDGVTYIEVPYKMEIGDDGADSVTVTMKNAEGNVVGTEITKLKGSTGSVKFASKNGLTYNFTSGTYTFTIKASREDETAKEGTGSESYTFILPLDPPTIRSVANTEKGSVEAKWYEAEEATGYEVTYYVKGNKPATAPAENTAECGVVTVTGVKASITGLNLDTDYTFEVVSLRANEDGSVDRSAKASSIDHTVKDVRETAWEFASFGASTDVKDGKSTNNGYDPESVVTDENGALSKVTVFSKGGKGKIVPLSADGLSFYYTQLDSVNDNFVLEADVHVDSWTLSNGQEGFGLLVTDRVGQNGDQTDPFWNNSYLAGATKIEYRWNTEAGELTTDSEVAANTSMKLGIGSIARTGAPAGYTGATSPKGFTSQTDTLDTSTGKEFGSGTYNIIGNYTGTTAPEGTKKTITDLHLKLVRDNTGYKISYTDQDGKTTTNVYYDEKCFDENCTEHNGYDNGTLMQMDKDSVYVGFFAARNATATFSNIQLTVTDAATDPEPEERVKKTIDPSFSVVSASNANSEDYTLEFYANAPGKLTIKQSDGTIIADNDIIEEDKDNNYNIDKKQYQVKLKKGDNKFTWTMVPDADYELGGEGSNTYLKSYNVRTGTFTVTYNTIGGKYIYVSPDGTAKGDGSEEKPLDIYSAVQYIGAGQTIVLMEGTYELKKSLSISRGINGTEEDPIYMIADPEAKTRPVIDFLKTPKVGMKIAGDYWYFKGFDVTHSGDATDGIQLSGSHNTLDDIRTYENGNTGIQISRLQSSDTNAREWVNGVYEYKYWPSYNTILNCTSYGNADAGYEDADGFAAKLTVGNGNVFDGCISAYNADDGWDLYAKSETGSIGMVTIKNCIAYANGYQYGRLDDDGNLLPAGNGNGFKMGGTSIEGKHTLINSIAFNNAAKGIDSNSCPDIQVYNCISFDNGSYNVALYTNAASNTAFLAKGVISYRKNVLTYEGTDASGNKETKAFTDQFKTTGSQIESDYNNETTYYWKGDLTSDTKGVSTNANEDGKVTDSWFKSLVGPKLTEFEIVSRDKTNNKIALGDFLALTEAATEGVGAKDLGSLENGQASMVIDKDTFEKEKDTLATENGLVVAAISDQTYTGKAIKPEIRVTDGINVLTTKDYSVSYKDNINAGEATIVITGKGNYTGTNADTKFNIAKKDIGAKNSGVTLKNTALAAAETGKAQKPKVSVLWNNKTLSSKDYSVKYYKAVTDDNGNIVENYDENGDLITDGGELKDGCTAVGKYIVKITGEGNYTGNLYANFTIMDKESAKTHLISKANVKLYFDGKKTSSFDATGTGITFNEEGSKYTMEVSFGKNTPLDKTQYTLSYIDNVEPGKATVTVTGKGDYAGEKQVTFTIKPVTINSAEIGRKIEVTDNETGDIHYEYVPGLGTVDYVGIDGGETTIISNNILSSIDKKVAGTNAVATAGSIYVLLKDNNGKEFTFKDEKGNNLKKTGKYTELVYGTDYTVAGYKNNNKAGSATLVVEGMGKYSGTAKAAFKINPYELSDSVIYKAPVKNEDGTYSDSKGNIRIRMKDDADGAKGLYADYLKGGVKLDDLVVEYVQVDWEDSTKTKFTETVNEVLTLGKDYTVSYRNNNLVGDSKSAKAPTVVITGKGNYKGKIEVKFTINAKALNYQSPKPVNKITYSVTVDAPDMFSKNWKSKVTVYDINNKALSNKIDYAYDYYYVNEDGSFGDKIPLTTKELTVGTTVGVKVTAGTNGCYTSENTTTYRVLSADKNIKKAKVVYDKNKPIYYRGDAITLDTLSRNELLPTITMPDGKVLVYNVNYKVVDGTYKSNVKKGTAKVTIQGISADGYEIGGTKDITFKIESKPLVKKSTSK